MSHISNIKTQIKNLVMLKRALNDLNIKIVEQTENARLTVRGWNSTTEDVQLVLKTGGPYDVGVVHNAKDDTYDFIADWWGVENYTEMNQNEYINKIVQRYAYNTVLDKINVKGYNVVNEEVDEKQNIRIVLRKWV